MIFESVALVLYINIIIILLFGFCVGSFLNVFILRHRFQKPLFGRSQCPRCGHLLLWYENIPLLSFFLLQGRCKTCGNKISWQYPLVEASTAILFVLAYIRFVYNQIVIPDHLFLITYFFFIAVLIIIFVYDLRWYLIPDSITIPAILIIFFLNVLIGNYWLGLLFSGIIGGGFFLLQYVISQGKWIGGGDIRLGALMGVTLGWKYLFLALFLAYVLGAFWGIMLLVLRKKKLSSKVPFGTFLCAATLVTLFFGQDILKFYMSVIGWHL